MGRIEKTIMKEVNLDNVDLNDDTYGNIRAYNIDNKDEYIDFKMKVKKFKTINLMGINEENIYFNGYDFFRDFHGVIRYSKVDSIESRFEILDL